MGVRLFRRRLRVRLWSLGLIWCVVGVCWLIDFELWFVGGGCGGEVERGSQYVECVVAMGSSCANNTTTTVMNMKMHRSMHYAFVLCICMIQTNTHCRLLLCYGSIDIVYCSDVRPFVRSFVYSILHTGIHYYHACSEYAYNARYNSAAFVINHNW